MELDCVEIFQAEVWKIILIGIFKIARSQFGTLNLEKPKWCGKLEVENVALSYWILKNCNRKSKEKCCNRILNSESKMESCCRKWKTK